MIFRLLGIDLLIGRKINKKDKTRVEKNLIKTLNAH